MEEVFREVPVLPSLMHGLDPFIQDRSSNDDFTFYVVESQREARSRHWLLKQALLKLNFSQKWVTNISIHFKNWIKNYDIGEKKCQESKSVFFFMVSYISDVVWGVLQPSNLSHFKTFSLDLLFNFSLDILYNVWEKNAFSVGK